jgi:hypothetical protein
LQRRESNPLLSGYEPDGSPLAFAAIKTIHPPDLHRPSVRYRRTAALSLLGWNGNWTRTPDSHRVRSVLQTDSSSTLPCAWKLVRYVGVAPTRRASQARMLLLHHHLSKWVLRSESHRHGLLYERSALLALPRRNETGAPARTCTSTLRLRTAACMALTPRELGKLRHAGSAPARAVWKTAMRAATSMTCNGG